MIFSIEIPVIRGGWLIQCIDSVLQQSSSNWFLTLYWDKGDETSRQLLESIDALHHPRIQVFLGSESLGISRARQFITQRSRGEFILPLDDDDVLQPDALKLMLGVAIEKPWATIVRARRGFIDDRGDPILMNDWFRFQRRQYFHGATCDVSNHSHPYAIRRDAFLAKGGWLGFSDFAFLGEDCSCFTQSEETGEIELLDRQLYSYRIHQQRTSLNYTPPDAEEMWRRIADESVSRRKAPVKRINERPPFQYVVEFKQPSGIEALDVIIPFWETDEREIPYKSSRPFPSAYQFTLGPDTTFHQPFRLTPEVIDRFEVAFTAMQPVKGLLSVAFFRGSRFTACEILSAEISALQPVEYEVVSLRPTGGGIDLTGVTDIEISFMPYLGVPGRDILLHVIRDQDSREAQVRMFTHVGGYCRQRLEIGLRSLAEAGIKPHQVHIIEDRKGSAANRNKGFRECGKEWICLMDDDVRIPGAGTLTTLLTCMVQNNAGLCGPKLVTPSGAIYSGPPAIDPVTQNTRITGLGERDNGQYDRNCYVPWIPSTLMIVHQSVALSTGGFDESYVGSQHEDADFCLRARSRGFDCYYAGKAMAIHDNMLRNGGFSQNMNYLKQRWIDRKDLFVWPTGQILQS
jgi:glycosyltransferase involved in cell wall biosynthesis